MKEGLNIERERICFKALSAVLRDGAYSAQALNDALKSSSGEDEYITRLFYGVLEKNITLEYIINALVEKRPKQAVYVVLKMGTYMARYMNTPIYAVVDRCVELSKSLGKEGACGPDAADGERAEVPLAPLFPGTRCIYMPLPRMDINATEIRRRWREGRCLNVLLPDAELALMRKHDAQLREAWG